MLYEFKCKEHGLFQVEQPLNEEHTADCPECGMPAQRIFSKLKWIWGGSAYRPDGSLRQNEDYAILKG